MRIHRLQSLGEREVQGLSEVLMDCAEGGASVSFILPFTRAKAESYWRGLGADVIAGRRIVLAAEDSEGTFLGTVSVVLDLPENQPHRGDVSKMLVHRRARRAGMGANCPAFFALNERADYEDFLRNAPRHYTVCVVAGRIEGAFGLIEREPCIAALNWILLSPYVQGTGVGSQMMQRAMEGARRQGCGVIEIAASHKSAPFFARFGARKVSETADGWGPGMHRIDMQWDTGATT